VRKLGSDRPDLLIRLLDDEKLRKSATHFFHQLGKGLGGGVGRSVGDVVGALPKGRPIGDVLEKAIQGAGVVTGGLTDAVVTPPMSAMQLIKKLVSKG